METILHDGVIIRSRYRAHINNTTLEDSQCSRHTASRPTTDSTGQEQQPYLQRIVGTLVVRRRR